MSILLGKSILIIGDENKQIVELEAILKRHQMHIYVAGCQTASIEEVVDKKIDIILLNHVHEGSACIQLLTKLQSQSHTRSLPIFALVENHEDKIKHALLLGAADYITTSEPVASIVQKIKIIFGQPDNFSSMSAIDISPINSQVNSKAIRVFIVEDDPLLRNLLAARLDRSAFPYEFSKDGTSVIDKLKLFKPQVIILDIMLPFKNGFEILTEIKAVEDLRSIPVIIFSNRDEPTDKQRSIALGANRFFVKALTDLSVLITAIEELAE